MVEEEEEEEKALTVLRAYYGPATAVRRLPQHGATLCAHGCVVSLCRDDNGVPVTVCRAPAVVHGFAVAPHAVAGGAVHVLAHGGRGRRRAHRRAARRVCRGCARR